MWRSSVSNEQFAPGVDDAHASSASCGGFDTHASGTSADGERHVPSMW
jgi:hypothetical protein